MLGSQYLSFDIEKLLSKLVHKELKFARHLEISKQKLARYPNYNLQYFFQEIDESSSNWIDITSLKKFLIRCSYLPNDNLLLAIIRRIDLDCDAQLNYLEFVDNFRPIENFMPSLKRSASSNKFKEGKWSISRPKSALNESPRRSSITVKGDFNLAET